MTRDAGDGAATGADERLPARRPGGAAGDGRVRTVILSLVSAALWSLAYPPLEVSWLAYLAPVPLLVMAVRSRDAVTVAVAAWAGGLAFFAMNLYWLTPFSGAGFVALSVYLGLTWAAVAWGVRTLTRATGVPLTLAAPVVWIALEWVRARLLTGLPWLMAGHTQYENLVLIQTADVLGAYGPGCLVLMTAGFVADLLTRPLVRPATEGRGARLHPVRLAMAGLVAAAWVGTVGYGVWRLGQDLGTDRTVTLASVQTAVPQEIKLAARHQEALKAERQMMRDLVRLTRLALAEADERGLEPDLVAWPETLVPGFLNAEFLTDDFEPVSGYAELVADLRFRQLRYRTYWDAVQSVAREGGVPVLFGANTAEVLGIQRLPDGRYTVRLERANEALLVTPDTPRYQAENRYAKVHLVPFGEYVPLRQSWPWLHGLLHRMTPYYPIEYSLRPGDPPQPVFEVAEGLRFQAAICFEDAFARRIRRIVSPDGRAKAVDLVVNISNDGWFAGTTEHAQHLNLCVFRAVENRVPILRSVNTGTSALIDARGRILHAVADAEGRRRNVEGFLVGRVGLDDRVAPYTRVGDLFAEVCVLAALAGGLVAIVKHIRTRKESPS